MSNTLILKFTTSELSYFNELSKITCIPKSSLISQSSQWLQKKIESHEDFELDLTTDYDKQTNPWKRINVYFDDGVKDQLQSQADYLNTTRYQLISALIKKIPELIAKDEFFKTPINQFSYKRNI